MSSREAQFKANQYDLDLLCVAPDAQPPVCKIINYSKYRFEQQKRGSKKINTLLKSGGHVNATNWCS